MDGKIFLATFAAVFLAELADKTQIVGIGMTARSGRPLSVWLGSVCAYAVVTLITVFIGVAFSKYIKPDLIRWLGGSIFIVIGIAMLLKLI